MIIHNKQHRSPIYQLCIGPALILLLLVFNQQISAESISSDLKNVLLKLGDKKAIVRKSAIIDLASYDHLGLTDLMEAFKRRQLYIWTKSDTSSQLVFCDSIGGARVYPKNPLTQERLKNSGGQEFQVSPNVLRQIRPARAERGLAENVRSLLKLSSPDQDKQLSGIKKCGEARTIKGLGQLTDLALTKLDQISHGKSVNLSKKARRLAHESALLIRITKTPARTGAAHIQLVVDLGKTKSQRSLKFLEKALATLEQDPELDEEIRRVYQAAIAKINTYQNFISLTSNLFQGISLGSVLILMALGLAITFGLMGVINMAHGELMMIGAYTTYLTQQVFSHSPEMPNDVYFIFALPASFLMAATVGFLMEFLVVRHLYKRPLESLLATWGIGLILIQLVRLRFGDNIGVNAPSWGRGGIEIVQDLIFPYGRCFIIAICIFSVTSIYYLMRSTQVGLMMRATMQNREMASGLGVNTDFVDRCTFAFGSGIAGVAGYAWTLIGGVTPNMGQTNFIVDSFLVVVTGGVGEIIGVICAGIGIGSLTKTIEPSIGTIWAKILLLVAVVIFIQFKPSGLFAPKGRLADD
ncbi:MAG: urea ABC transporter permease subunit UrtB [Candidatus Poribacteria bacterium]|nr:urea ABC transporter permease subunit UrtB [Candidatus Poribacteria bacterium]